MNKLNNAHVVAVVGGQWGDEGKGKIVDYLAETADFVVRSGGGANAGHTIYVNDKKYVFHLIPSGILHDKVRCVIGHGCVVDLEELSREIKTVEDAGVSVKGKLFLSDRAHLVLPYHMAADKAQEQIRKTKIGTTCRGIGPCYADKIQRRGIRAGELFDFASFAERFKANAEYYQKRYNLELDIEATLASYQKLSQQFEGVITDTLPVLHNALRTDKRIITEGAQATHLDIDLGTYPFVTSSCTTAAGAAAGSGIPPSKIDYVLGVLKAYTTRVGEGPFPAELDDKTAEHLQKVGHEFGATTGRPRRCGWLDAVVARYSAEVNGVTAWNITKLDVLSGLPELKIVTGYQVGEQLLTTIPASAEILAAAKPQVITMPGWQEDISSCRSFADLPINAQKYLDKIVELTKTPIQSIGVGAEREALIIL